MVKYKAETHWGKIIKVEVEKETAKTVTINGVGCDKETGYYKYFDTWKKAKEYLVKSAQGKIDSLRNQLERAKGELGNVKGMRED